MASNPGDIVWLKSGGPPMTVNSLDGTNVNVQWFVGNQFQTASLPAASLTTTDPAPALARARQAQDGML